MDKHTKYIKLLKIKLSLLIIVCHAQDGYDNEGELAVPHNEVLYLRFSESCLFYLTVKHFVNSVEKSYVTNNLCETYALDVFCFKIIFGELFFFTA